MVPLEYWWLQMLLHTDWTSLMLLMSLTDLLKDIYDFHRIGRGGRAGKSSLATAFFCDKNIPLAKALVELMQASNQEVRSWLNQHAERSTSVGNGNLTGQAGLVAMTTEMLSPGSENYNYSSNYEGPDSSMVLLMLVLLMVVNAMLLQKQIHMLLVDMEKAMNRQLPLAGIRALLRSLSFALTYMIGI